MQEIGIPQHAADLGDDRLDAVGRFRDVQSIAHQELVGPRLPVERDDGSVVADGVWIAGGVDWISRTAPAGVGIGDGVAVGVGDGG